VWLVWVGGVVQRFAVQSNADISLWYPWPDGLPALLFMTAFLLVCRDVWRLNHARFGAVVWSRASVAQAFRHRVTEHA
jgi:hypothetical protein